MIELKNVSKEYQQGTETVRAVRGIDLHLRDRELVTVQGEHASGKSTLLRLLAGMESCSHGDILFAGRSAKSFKAADWASWRSSAAGLVLDGEELLAGESAAMNVELPMRLAGMARGVRQKRTVSILRRLGLGDKLRVNASALTEYERRRLSVARALANDPDVLLADEPFRGLSAENAAELMDLFATIARDRLVVLFCSADMPAREEGVRAIRLMGGRLIYDSAPWGAEDSEAPPRPWQRSILGLRDSVMLALHAARQAASSVFLAVLAASLALCALGLRLSLETSLKKAEAEEQREALTIAPYTIERETPDEAALLSLLEQLQDSEAHSDGVYSAAYRPALLEAEGALGQRTDIRPFLDSLEGKNQLYSLLQTVESSELNIYASDTSLELRKLENFSDGTLWAELPGDGSILRDQYEVVAGRWCASWDEVVLFVDENNELSDVAMAALGLSGGESGKRNYEDLCAVTFRLLLPTDYYQRGADGLWAEIQDESLLRAAVNEGSVLRVVGILRPSEKSRVHAFPAVLGYPASLRRTIAESVAHSPAVQEQRADMGRDIFTGLPFLREEMRSYSNTEKAAALREMVETGVDVPTQMAMYCRITGSSEADAAYKVSNNLLSAELGERLRAMPDGDCAGLYNSFVLSGYSQATAEGNLARLGVSGEGVEKLRIYTSSVEQRQALLDYVREWNAAAVAQGRWSELIYGSDEAEALAAVSGKHSKLLLQLLSAFALIAMINAFGLLAALLSAALERQRATLRSIYLLGISPTDRSALLRTEGLLLGLCCSVLGFGLCIGFSFLLPRLSLRLWGLRMAAGIPWLAAAIALPGGVILGLLAALPAWRKAGKVRYH